MKKIRIKLFNKLDVSVYHIYHHKSYIKNSESFGMGLKIFMLNSVHRSLSKLTSLYFEVSRNLTKEVIHRKIKKQ